MVEDNNSDSIFHLDTGDIFKAERTPEGYLNCHARVARVGILEYQTADGKTRCERVTPEVLYNKDSYHTLKMKPITVPEHPPVLLDVTNHNQYAKGTTSNIVTIDGDFLGVIMTITNADAIKAIESGINQVSCGYMATCKPLPDGTFQQTSREYNHLAIVPQGRAGKDVRLTLDSCDIPIYSVTMPSLTLKLDEYSSVELPLDVGEKIKGKLCEDAKTIKTLTAKCDSLGLEVAKFKESLANSGFTSLDALLATRDSLAEKLTSIEARLDSQPIVDVAKLLRERRSLERQCEGFLPDDFNLDTATDRELMTAVILKNTRVVNCDSLSDEYVKARFDGVIEDKNYNVDTSQLALTATNLSVTTPTSEIDKLRLDVQSAQEEYLKTFVNIGN